MADRRAMQRRAALTASARSRKRRPKPPPPFDLHQLPKSWQQAWMRMFYANQSIQEPSTRSRGHGNVLPPDV